MRQRPESFLSFFSSSFLSTSSNERTNKRRFVASVCCRRRRLICLAFFACHIPWHRADVAAAAAAFDVQYAFPLTAGIAKEGRIQ
jgi:hypothetical protein